MSKHYYKKLTKKYNMGWRIKFMSIMFNGNEMKILRKKLGLNQEDMGKELGVTKNYISQLENLKRNITEEIDRELQRLQDEYTTKKNSMKERNQRYLEEVVERNIREKEERNQLIKEITKTRKQQKFNPSVLPSVDMVWLSSTMDKYLTEDFEREFLGFGVGSKNISEIDMGVELKDKGYPTLQNGRYQLLFECTDGKIFCEYLFITKEMGSTPVPRIKVQFNPNKVKWNNPYLIRLMKYLGVNPLMRKFDICKDYVGMCTKHFIPTSRGRKDIRSHHSTGGSLTIQFGDMNNGGVRVYDKRGELKEKDKYELPYECTRYEHRVTLKKSIDLYNLVNFGDDKILTYGDGSVKFDFTYNVDFPVLNMINREFTRETCGIDVTQSDVNNIRTMMRGDCTLWDFTRREQERFKDIIDNLQTEVITMTNVDIKQALTTFITDYRDVYNTNYNLLSYTE